MHLAIDELFNKTKFRIDERLQILTYLKNNKETKIIYNNLIIEIEKDKKVPLNLDLIFTSEEKNYFKQYGSIWYDEKNKYYPFIPILKTKEIRRTNDLLAFFDYETYDTTVEAGKINKLEHKEKLPLIISYIVVNPSENNIVLDKQTFTFYEEKFDKEKMLVNHERKIKYWVNNLFALLQINARKDIHIWAHNFSGFDSYIFIKTLGKLSTKDNPLKIRLIKKDRKNYILRISKSTFVRESSKIKHTLNLNFYCRILLLRGRLSNLAKSFEVENMKIFFPYDLVREENWSILRKDLEGVRELIKNKYREDEIILFKNTWKTLNFKDIIEYYKFYCIIDVEILKDVICKFIKSFDEIHPNTNIGYSCFITASRLRIETFLHSGTDFYDENIIAIHTNRDLDSFIRQAYHGGRCEVFKGWNNERKKVYYYDFPGIYRICIKINLPIGEGLRIKIKIPLKRDEIIEKLFIHIEENNLVGFLNVKTLLIEENRYIPLLPSKFKDDEEIQKLTFIYGHNNGVYFREELKILINNGGKITELREMVLFKSGKPLYKYREFNLNGKNERKKNKNKIIETLYKLLNNSLYGKFAIKDYDRKWIIDAGGNFKKELKEINKKLVKNIEEINGVVYVEIVEDKETKWYLQGRTKTNVAVATAIASYGRVILATSILNIKKNNPHAELIYCDTDRIFWEREKDIVCKDMFNELRWETINIYKKGMFLRSKFYCLINEDGTHVIKRKGVKSRKLSLEDFENFIRGQISQINVVRNIIWIKIIDHFPLTRMTDKCISPFKRTKRKYIMENGLWTGLTSAYVNKIRKNIHVNFQFNKQLHSTKNIIHIPLKNNPLWNKNMEVSLIDLKDRRISHFQLDNFNIYLSLSGNKNVKFYNLTITNRLEILKKYDYKFEKYFEKLYYLIHLIAITNMEVVDKIGIIVTLEYRKSYTLSPKYLRVNDICLSDPEIFSTYIIRILSYWEESYGERALGLSKRDLFSEGTELVLRIIKQP